MKKRIRNAVVIGFSMAFLAHHFLKAQQPEDSQQRETPSLIDTESWIKLTFTEETAGRSDCQEYDPEKPGVNYGPYASCTYSAYKISFEACKVTLEVHQSTGGTGVNGQKPDEYNFKRDSVVSFNLGDIDPTTIKLGTPRGTYGDLKKKTHFDNPPSMVEVHFATSNNLDRIQVLYPYSSYLKDRPEKAHACCGMGEWGIAVKPDYAPRFVKALDHAVQLCGGKPSTF